MFCNYRSQKTETTEIGGGELILFWYFRFVFVILMTSELDIFWEQKASHYPAKNASEEARSMQVDIIGLILWYALKRLSSQEYLRLYALSDLNKVI